MRKCLTLSFLLLISSKVFGGIVLDPDTTTPTVYESTITVVVGTQLRMAAVETSGVSQPRDRVGLNLSWGLSGDTATANPLPLFTDSSLAASRTAAGDLANATNMGNSEDLFVPGGLVTAGTGLASSNVAPFPGYSFSLGGMGYDANTTAGDFSELPPVEVMYWEVEFPTVGTVHMGACGILDGSNNGSPTLSNGNEYHEIDFDISFPGPCAGIRIDVVPVAIPEPNGFLLLASVALMQLSVGYVRRVRRLSKLVE